MRYTSVFFFYLSTLSYFVAFVLYLLYAVLGAKQPQPISETERGGWGIVAAPTRTRMNADWGLWATRALIGSVAIATLGVIFRAIELGNASQWVKAFFLPLSTTYETLTFFAWLISFIYLLVERRFELKQVGVFVAGAAFVMLSVAASPSFAPSAPTGVPASLQSYWLTTHVLFMVIGIAFFTSGFGATLLYLWRRYAQRAFLLFGTLLVTLAGIIFGVIPLFAALKPLLMIGSVLLLLALAGLFAVALWWAHQRDLRESIAWESLESVEEMVYRCVALGFPFYAIGGLVFGGIWAEQAWSRYWGWDPKETAMLVTALIYAVYLHARLTWGGRDPSWRGGLVAWLAVFGYLAVLYAWLGINYFIASLHSFV